MLGLKKPAAELVSPRQAAKRLLAGKAALLKERDAAAAEITRVEALVTAGTLSPQALVMPRATFATIGRRLSAVQDARQVLVNTCVDKVLNKRASVLRASKAPRCESIQRLRDAVDDGERRVRELQTTIERQESHRGTEGAENIGAEIDALKAQRVRLRAALADHQVDLAEAIALQESERVELANVYAAMEKA